MLFQVKFYQTSTKAGKHYVLLSPMCPSHEGMASFLWYSFPRINYNLQYNTQTIQTIAIYSLQLKHVLIVNYILQKCAFFGHWLIGRHNMHTLTH
jgi:hypothetical protein